MDELLPYLASALARGEAGFAAVVADAAEHLELSADDPALHEVTDGAFAAYRAEQAGWSGLLPAEALLAACRDLDVSGIVARTDFTCCQTCGVAEIGAETAAAARARGYAFCHAQDVDASAAGHGLHLSFGTAGEDGDAAAIGREVVAALAARGVAAEWDGDPGRRITVPLTWRRRRYASLAWSPSAAAEPVPASAPPTVLVTYCDYPAHRYEDEGAAMTFEELRGVACALLPVDGNFLTCQDAAGTIVQAMWEKNGRLWLEIPDSGAGMSRGLYATLDRLVEVAGALAAGEIIDLDRYGEVTTVRWKPDPLA